MERDIKEIPQLEGTLEQLDKLSIRVNKKYKEYLEDMETDFKTNYLFSKYKDKSLCNKMNKYNLSQDASRLRLNYTVVYKMIVNYQIIKYGCQLNSTGYEYKIQKYRVDSYILKDI